MTESPQFIVQQELGSGSSGSVFSATEISTGKAVVIKIIPIALAEQAHREITIQRILGKSLYTLELLHVQQNDQIIQIIMEYLPKSRPLSKLNPGMLTMRQKCNVALKLLAGLAFIHTKGVIHGDVKPENLLITDDLSIRYIDYDLACTRPGIVPEIKCIQAGSLAYMAPEVAQGGATTIQGDVFSLGAILYELFTGFEIWEDLQQDDVLRVLLYAPEYTFSKPSGSALIEMLLAGMLEFNPQKRMTLDAAIRLVLQVLNHLPKFSG